MIQRLTTSTAPFQMVSILDGKTKSDFELVIARYDEDIHWSDNYKEFRTIYNKGEPLDCESIPLENKGHLADTILKHILAQYTTLAKTTFFCHGSFNYRKDQQIKESGTCHRLWQEFISLKNNTCVYIPRDDLEHHSVRYEPNSKTVGEVYEQFFKRKYKPTFTWACGLWISVSKELIHRQPISFYKEMHDWILEGNPSQEEYRSRGIYIERFLLHAFLVPSIDKRAGLILKSAWIPWGS